MARSNVRIPDCAFRVTEFELCAHGSGHTNAKDIFDQFKRINTQIYGPGTEPLLLPPRQVEIIADSPVAINASAGIPALASDLAPTGFELPAYRVSDVPTATSDIFAHGKLPLLDSTRFQSTEFGRTTVFSLSTPLMLADTSITGIAIKMARLDASPAHKPTESHVELCRELQIQAFLSQDSNIKSTIPKPIGYINSSQFNTSFSGLSSHHHRERHAIAFGVPDGYYEYISTIRDTDIFTKGLCKAAFDLGYLLWRYGLVFPALISIFHAEGRPYTLLPGVNEAQVGCFGGLPGRIGGVIGQKLYENIGRSGLRDFGDLIHLSCYQFRMKFDSNPETELNWSEPLKIAHFISLYSMVFTILIGNRARMMESSSKDEDAWMGHHKLYSLAMQELFQGLGLTLTTEQLRYIDPAKTKTNAKKLTPAEKYDRQLRFVFTQFKSQLFQLPESGKNSFYSHQRAICGTTRNNEIPVDITGEEEEILKMYLMSIYGSNKVCFYGKTSKIKEKPVNGGRFYGPDKSKRYSRSHWVTFNNKDDFYHTGSIGTFSGVNPLLTAWKNALRAAHLVLEYFYLVMRPQEVRTDYDLWPKNSAPFSTPDIVVPPVTIRSTVLSAPTSSTAVDACAANTPAFFRSSVVNKTGFVLSDSAKVCIEQARYTKNDEPAIYHLIYCAPTNNNASNPMLLLFLYSDGSMRSFSCLKNDYERVAQETINGTGIVAENLGAILAHHNLLASSFWQQFSAKQPKNWTLDKNSLSLLNSYA